MTISLLAILLESARRILDQAPIPIPQYYLVVLRSRLLLLKLLTEAVSHRPPQVLPHRRPSTRSVEEVFSVEVRQMTSRMWTRMGLMMMIAAKTMRFFIRWKGLLGRLVHVE
ncbi:hypothetical protein PHYBOEH_001599 [Phytophthora boehmeriae]|uniref:Uncharacterized protein n=1 Tax=Phytophthora boehmeriae TaxID=109152 RepID=A0A8T1V7Q9_9STRA|nr:hypothetical protein PHYBOEH_001599 [Phytophthora boehmeriae]